MTKKLINRTLLIGLLYIIFQYAVPYYIGSMHAYMDERKGMVSQQSKDRWPGVYSDNKVSDYMTNYESNVFLTSSFIIGVLLIFVLVGLISAYADGFYDDFFKEYTDPKLKEICDWIHRRNNGCPEELTKNK